MYSSYFVVNFLLISVCDFCVYVHRSSFVCLASLVDCSSLSLFFPFSFFILFYLNKTKNSSVQLFLNFPTANNSQQSSELHIEHRQEKRKTRTSRLAASRVLSRGVLSYIKSKKRSRSSALHKKKSYTNHKKRKQKRRFT